MNASNGLCARRSESEVERANEMFLYVELGVKDFLVDVHNIVVQRNITLGDFKYYVRMFLEVLFESDNREP